MSELPVPVEVSDWLARRAVTHPDARAVECGDVSLTYAGLHARVEALAGALRTLAVAGRPVAALLENSLEMAVLAHAAPRAGGWFMPLNARLAPAELAWQLDDAGAALLVCHAATSPVARAAGEQARTPVVSVEDLASAQADGSPQAAGESLPDVRAVIYTSGTTGRPKGALLTAENFYWSAVASAENLGVEEGDRWLACLPLFHVGGLSILLRSAIYGTTAVIHERFDERRANRALRREGVTLLSVVPTMLQRMLDVDDLPYPPTVRAVLLGGGPAPRPLLEAAAARGLPVLQTYGLTEAASQVTTLAPEDALSKLGSAGLPLLASTVRIESEGRAAEAGEVGEILVSGPIVCAGYLGRPEAAAEAIRDGWLHTGDLGYLDSEGYLYVADRRDDLIVTGGENVYPAEVEEVLSRHPGVAECAVVGLPDDHWGARVTAVVVARDRPPPAAELDALVRARLAGYKAPRQYVIVEEPLPRTASGKLQRRLVRERLHESR